MVGDDYHKWILFNDNEIEIICMELRGYTYDNTVNAFKQIREPLLNEQGITALKIELKSILSTNTLLSNIFSEEDMKSTAFIICKNILSTLTLNAKKWKIHPKNKHLIISILSNYVDFALRRAFKEGERNFAKETMKTYRNVDETQQNKTIYENKTEEGI